MIGKMNKIEQDSFSKRLIEKGWGKSVSEDVLTFSFTYNSDGNHVKGYLSHPANHEAKMPVIIWNRGGNDESGLLDDFLACGILGEIASWGYVVFASQYREKDEFGGSDVNDVLNLINVAKNFELSDNRFIGMEGWSRGGMMSYLTLANSNEIKACVIVAGLSDLPKNEKHNAKIGDVFFRLFGCSNNTEFNKRKIARSAVSFPEKISKDTRILFIHGTKDDKILTDDSIEMYNKLCSLNGNSNYDLKLIEGGDHYLRNNRKQISEYRKKWFEKNLK